MSKTPRLSKLLSAERDVRLLLHQQLAARSERSERPERSSSSRLAADLTLPTMDSASHTVLVAL